ncbi:hypothetical protein HanIR_Chr12g0561001 [Helianthus annuus]|nr:hypothetical protein HanIR_Chr12g0561001 [Helianthus annuus]
MSPLMYDCMITVREYSFHGRPRYVGGNIIIPLLLLELEASSSSSMDMLEN